MRKGLGWALSVLGVLVALLGLAVMVWLGPDSRISSGPHPIETDGTVLAVTLNEYNVCVNPRAVKKTGKKKAPARKGGQRQMARKPVGRKAPAGSGRKARRQTPVAKKAGASSGEAVPATSPSMGRDDDPPIAD